MRSKVLEVVVTHISTLCRSILPLPPTEVNQVAAVSAMAFGMGSFGAEQAIARIA